MGGIIDNPSAATMLRYRTCQGSSTCTACTCIIGRFVPAKCGPAICGDPRMLSQNNRLVISYTWQLIKKINYYNILTAQRRGCTGSKRQIGYDHSCTLTPKIRQSWWQMLPSSRWSQTFYKQLAAFLYHHSYYSSMPCMLSKVVKGQPNGRPFMLSREVPGDEADNDWGCG